MAKQPSRTRSTLISLLGVSSELVTIFCAAILIVGTILHHTRMPPRCVLISMVINGILLHKCNYHLLLSSATKIVGNPHLRKLHGDQRPKREDTAQLTRAPSEDRGPAAIPRVQVMEVEGIEAPHEQPQFGQDESSIWEHESESVEE